MTGSNQNEWITDMLMGSTSTTPAELLEEVMTDPRCVAFGPVHHYIVGGALLACWRNAEASPTGTACLPPILKRWQNAPKQCQAPHAPIWTSVGQQLPPAWLTPSSATMHHCRRYEQDAIN